MSDDGSSSGGNQPPMSHFKSQEDQDLIRLALHKSPFFTCLDEEQIERFVRTARKEVYPPGSIVILEGCVDDEDYGDENDTPGDVNIRAPLVAPPYDGVAEDCSVDTQDELYGDELQENSLASLMATEPSVGEMHENSLDTSSLSESRDASSVDISKHSPTLEDHIHDDLLEPFNDESNLLQSSTGSNPEQETDTHALESSTQQETNADATKSQEATDTEPPLAGSPHSVFLPDTSMQYVPAPRSGKVRSLFIIRKGKADVWYQQRNNHGDINQPSYIQPHAMGPGTLFGEGGFLFGRQHSASIVASRVPDDQDLECWVVDLPTFRDYVLQSDNMKAIFQQFASGADKKMEDENVYMTLDDFIKSCANEQIESSDILASPFPTSAAAKSDPWTRARVAGILQLLQPRPAQSYQRIFLKDFCWFYFLLARPDPEVDIAFLLMDQRQSGQVGLAQVAALVEPVFPQTNYESDFFRRYFGENGQQRLRLANFSQFFADLQQELGRQVFVRASKSTNGYLKPDEFITVLQTALGWRLSAKLTDRLENLYCRGPSKTDKHNEHVSIPSAPPPRETTAVSTRRANISVVADMEESVKGFGDLAFQYADFLAFQEVITNLPGICSLIERAEEIKKGPLSPDDFKVANRVLGMGGRLSRRQVDIVFTLFDLDKDGYISHQDTIDVCGVDFARRLVALEGRDGKLTFAPPPEYQPSKTLGKSKRPKKASVSDRIIHALEYFGVTALTGGLGTILLYPVDLVKTRLMNQRLDLRRTRMYRGFFHCFRQAFAKEGFFGLYRGLTPQLLGLAPEKMIKLQVNDLLRKTLGSKDKETGKPLINLPLEVLAGAVSGACQLLVTNPMELAKIRMQTHGETARILAERGWAITKPQSFVNVVKSLGFPGIYRGASSCLLRDVFFGAFYFPTYTWMKEQLTAHNEIPGYTTSFNLLAAGTLAGIPAAFLTTPFDVVKTRLQALPRPGETVYVGIRDCALTIHKQEGISGFFLGSGARVVRIAPQFGITLLVYETLTEMMGPHGWTRSPAPPTNAFVEPYDYHTAFPTTGMTHLMKVFGIEQAKDDRKEG